MSIQHKYKNFFKKIFASKKERIMDFKFKKFETQLNLNIKMTLLKFIFLGIKLHVSSGFQPKLLHTYTTQACAHKCNSAIFYVIYLFLSNVF